MGFPVNIIKQILCAQFVFCEKFLSHCRKKLQVQGETRIRVLGKEEFREDDKEIESKILISTDMWPLHFCLRGKDIPLRIKITERTDGVNSEGAVGVDVYWIREALNVDGSRMKAGHTDPNSDSDPSHKLNIGSLFYFTPMKEMK